MKFCVALWLVIALLRPYACVELAYVGAAHSGTAPKANVTPPLHRQHHASAASVATAATPPALRKQIRRAPGAGAVATPSGRAGAAAGAGRKEPRAVGRDPRPHVAGNRSSIQSLHGTDGLTRSNCDEALSQSGPRTVLLAAQDGIAFGFADQVWSLAQLIAQACRRGYNVAGKAFADIREDDQLDVVDFFDLQASNKRLRTNAFRDQQLCPRVNVIQDEARLDCSNTQLVPFHCVNSMEKKVMNKVEMFPKTPEILFSLVPTRHVVWNSHGFKESEPYNAVHVDLDIDRVLFLCDYSAWFRWVSNQLPSGDEQAFIGRGGRYASFVTEFAIPAYLDAMRKLFKDKSLPVAVVTSLTRVTDATSWIYSALAEGIKKARLAGAVVASEGLDYGREVNAAVDLRVISGGRDVVLVPGSTFSETAAVHTGVRGGRAGYTSDFRRSCNPAAWPRSGNGIFGANSTTAGPDAGCLSLAGMDFPPEPE